MLSKYLDRLFDAINVARTNYGIWYVYKNSTDRPKYADVMNDYEWFFRPSISAHFIAMLMSLSQIYEKGKKTITIHVLLSKL